MMHTVCALMIAVAAQAPEIHVFLGQSLSQGGSEGTLSATAVALTTTQSQGNVMLTGRTTDCATYRDTLPWSAWPTIPLIEGNVNCGAASYWGESERSSYANQYGSGIAVISDAQGGTVYTGLKSGTAPWTEMTKGLESLGARGWQVTRALVIHGDNDHVSGTTRATYAANMVEWQSDLTAKAMASSRTQSNVLMLIEQFSAWTKYGQATSVIPLAQYDVARAYPSSIILAQPKYQYIYNTSGIHLVNSSYQLSGKVLGEASKDGASWQPLWPRLTSPVSRAGAVITLQLYTPTPPLVVGSCARITGVSASTQGFEYTDSAGSGTISSVAGGTCSGNVCPVTITLSADPSGHTAKLLRYAYTGTPGANAGPTTGARGNVCDSRASPDANYLVTFEESVP